MSLVYRTVDPVSHAIDDFVNFVAPCKALGNIDNVRRSPCFGLYLSAEKSDWLRKAYHDFYQDIQIQLIASPRSPKAFDVLGADYIAECLASTVHKTVTGALLLKSDT